MRVFLAVARTGRLAAAARQMAVEHTTISRRIAALEQDLGVPLFYRTAGGHRLTPHGQKVLASAEAMESAALLVGAKAREGAARVAGRVRIALLEEYATHWLVPQLPVLRKTHPELEVQVIVGIPPLDLTRGEADIALRFPRPRQPGLTATPVPPATLGLYASRKLVGRRPLQITDTASLRGLPLAVYVPQYHQLQSARWFQPVLAAARVVMTTNSTHSLLAAAKASLAVAVLARFIARRHDDLVPVSADVATGPMWIVMHTELRSDPRVRATADFLKTIARSLHG